jgi:branched-chain amino acid aminotransferase
MPLEELASVDGEIAPTAQTAIPVQDDGLYRGDGVFEVIRLYSGRPFALGEHLDRLERSAAAIELPVDRATLEAEIAALLDRGGDENGQLRLLLTRAGRRIALTEELPPRPETIRLATVTYSPTVILTGVKSLSYGANMQATRIAAGRGADEAVLVRPDGIVLEAPTSSIFWVDPAGTIHTPPLSEHILASITRYRVMEVAQVAERPCTMDGLREASEAFLASTTREVQSIAAIEDIELPEGERTRETRAVLRARIEAELAAG